MKLHLPRWGLTLVLALEGILPLAAPALAQAPNNFLGAPDPDTPQVPEVGDNDLATLSLNGRGAISLRATLAGLAANPGADAAIKLWVARGNVVFLHTDAARSFGFATAPIRLTTPDQAGQEFIRTRAALPFGAHPLLRGDNSGTTNANTLNPTSDVTRLPGVRRVFGTLRDNDVFVVASDVATPLLQLEDVTGDGNTPPLYAAAITSLGAGWAIFCPDEVDTGRGDGALFARALQTFIPGATGQRWVGIPTRSLQAGTLATLAAAVGARLQVATATDSTAALPAFGTNAAPALAPPTSEPTLPIERAEASSFLSIVEAGGVRATARIGLMQARLALQNGDPSTCISALNVAAADPALAGQVDFWNAVVNAQLGADVSLPSTQRAVYFDQAARAFASSAALSASPANNGTGAPAQNGAAFPVSANTKRDWSQKLARLSAISTLSPPLVRTLVAGDATASIRFFPGDPNAPGLDAAVQGLLGDLQFGWRAPHVEIVLLPDAANFFALRRVLGRNDANFAPDGDQVGETILLTSAGNLRRGANEDTLKRLWSRVLLNTWSDGARPLPPWLVAGIQGISLGGNTPADTVVVRNAARAGALSLLSDNPEGIPVVTPLQRAESNAFMEWFYSTYGVGATSSFVARLAAGLSLEDAISGATGDDLATVGDNWRQSLGI